MPGEALQRQLSLNRLLPGMGDGGAAGGPPPAAAGPAGRGPVEAVLQVVSDVDDTIKSSGNLRFAGIPLGGIDAQYGRNEFYPGVMQFAIEVSRRGQADIKSIPDVAILTARAREFKFALELKETSAVNQNFRAAGFANGLNGWGIGPVLYGSVQEWIIQSRKADRKLRNFGALLEKLPKDRRIVFVGDTGEKDEKASIMMAKNHKDRLAAVFLHAVSDKGRVERLPEDREVRSRKGGLTPVRYFRTYVGAAHKAAELELMTDDGVRRVINAAKNSLRGVPRSSSKWADLDQDIRAAEAFLDKRSNRIFLRAFAPLALW